MTLDSQIWQFDKCHTVSNFHLHHIFWMLSGRCFTRYYFLTFLTLIYAIKTRFCGVCDEKFKHNKKWSFCFKMPNSWCFISAFAALWVNVTYHTSWHLPWLLRHSFLTFYDIWGKLCKKTYRRMPSLGVAAWFGPGPITCVTPCEWESTMSFLPRTKKVI